MVENKLWVKKNWVKKIGVEKKFWFEEEKIWLKNKSVWKIISGRDKKIRVKKKIVLSNKPMNLNEVVKNGWNIY